MRRLSSGWTFVHKFIFPIVFLGGFAVATAIVYSANFQAHDQASLELLRWVFPGIFCIAAVSFWFLVIPLKQVDLNGDVLVVSNYSRSIEIPLRDVERVTASIMLNPETIWIRLRTPSEFGSRITFLPRWRFHSGFTRHPMAAELTDLVAQAQTAAEQAPSRFGRRS